MTITAKYIIKRNSTSFSKKSMVYVLVVTVMFVLFLLTHSSELRNSTTKNRRLQEIRILQNIDQIKRPSNRLKFILLWTDPDASPFIYFGKGQSVFVNKSCQFTNCYVTGDRNYLGNYVLFDAILFNGPQLPQTMTPINSPKIRSLHQKYIYANIESAANYPVCTKVWNSFFNWTWTYKLDSNSIWGYFALRNATNAVIGPKTDIQWIHVDNMEDIGDKLKSNLKTKTKAAAWFSSNCKTSSKRENLVFKLRNHLKNFSLDVDVYGDCGDHQCPREINDRCLETLQRDYYFYLAFENSISVDYVTEKILYAYLHNTVPVVFGGADYSRFIPSGSYLNAYELGPEKLAQKIYEIITNPQIYYKFFRWKKYYTFHFRHESPETDDYCKFCALLNDDKLVSKTSIVDNFDRWWNDNNTCYKEHYHSIDDFDYVYEGSEGEPRRG